MQQAGDCFNDVLPRILFDERAELEDVGVTVESKFNQEETQLMLSLFKFKALQSGLRTITIFVLQSDKGNNQRLERISD